MLYSRYIAALFLLFGVMVYAQPLRSPKLSSKFASFKSAAVPSSKVQKLEAPKTDEEVTSQDTTSEFVKTEAVKIEWLTFEEAMEKQKTEPRKIFMDVYTEWCGWCKKMDASTFADKDVIEVLNDKYYAVKFDAEQKEDIEFKGKTYKFVSGGRRGSHELAKLFLNGRMGYPTSVFLDEQLEVIQPIPGYLDATKMDMILNYFGTDAYQKMPWDTYEKQYKKNAGE